MQEQVPFFSDSAAKCIAYLNIRDGESHKELKCEIDKLWNRFRFLEEPNFRENAKNFLL